MRFTITDEVTKQRVIQVAGELENHPRVIYVGAARNEI